MPSVRGMLGRHISPGRNSNSKSPARNRNKGNRSRIGTGSSPPPPPPPVAPPSSAETETEALSSSSIDWASCDVHYMVRSPWEWVMNEVVVAARNKNGSNNGSVVKVDKTADLPSSQRAAMMKNASNGVSVDSSLTRRQRRSNMRKRSAVPATLRIEVSTRRKQQQQQQHQDDDDDIILHGTSSCFDGLEDKDELCRTLQRCRCDHLNLSPPTVLIGWDVKKEECHNLVGSSMPVLPGNKSSVKFAVLKEPMGSKGTGIFFVKDADEIHEIISEHKKRATEEPEFLDNMIAAKGRIPSWVLQAEVNPCYLLEGKFKFHLRSYIVAVEKLNDPQLIDLYIYKHHEVRVAKVPIVGEGGKKGYETSTTRDRDAHITNGALSSDNVNRSLLSQIPELVQKNFQSKIELFLAQTFQHFKSDMIRRVAQSIKEDQQSATAVDVTRKFAIGGVDMMISEDGTIYLLEVNVNPAAPPQDTVNNAFEQHLVHFMKNLIDLVVAGKYSQDSFISTSDIS